MTKWKTEIITPIPKVHPAPRIKSLRPLSGIMNCPKIFDKILAEYILNDMAATRDKQQYGNEKNMSLNHLLINLLNKILTALDKNAADEKYGVILTLICRLCPGF